MQTRFSVEYGLYFLANKLASNFSRVEDRVGRNKHVIYIYMGPAHEMGISV